MKTLRIIGVVALLCFILQAFVSCDKDDNDEPDDTEQTDPSDPNDEEQKLDVSKILGSYYGTLDAKVMGIDCDMPGEFMLAIQAEPKDDDEVQVVIPETSFKYPGSENISTIPSFTITEVDVERSGDNYAISEDNYSVVMNGVEYSGRIEGSVTGNTADLLFTVRPGAMPMDIVYTFKGELK